ncbi:MAG: hypothetical protein ABFS30_16090 [Pseudomonadota bacterium]
MIVGRVIGWLLVLLGIGILALDIINYLETKAYKPVSVGRLWFEIDSDSLQQLQPAIERHVNPALWSDGIQPFLETPSFIVFALIGIIIAFAFRKRVEKKESVVT